MMIGVRFFSVARERAGTSYMQLDVPRGATLATALEQTYAALPKMREIGNHSMFAVGFDYASPDTILDDGIEISFIPPVQGG